ncbi:MAG: diaminopimelate epimerase [Phycisphaerae bacterium]|nr:diaminopimelate epimerase [Phycisphaerae bacterium]
MRFTKMHGIGNDYVYVNGFDQSVADPAELARVMADRHFGVGGDGLILVLPSQSGDVRMRMFNADGSESAMCGNGVRCVAKFAYDHGLARVNPIRVETAAGLRTIHLIFGKDNWSVCDDQWVINDDGNPVRGAMVDMGEPILEPARIPVLVESEHAVNVPLAVDGRTFEMTCVSMGNPHAVIYVDDLATINLAEIGPKIEHHPLFPQRVNVHFVRVHDSGHVTMATWERGSGITLACGTGASAVCVAGVLTGRSARIIDARLPGGHLHLDWRESVNRVIMTGPATEVFTGTWPG